MPRALHTHATSTSRCADTVLMQTIARVNRVFKRQAGGLIVDYLGIADELRRALSDYSERDKNESGIRWRRRCGS